MGTQTRTIILTTTHMYYAVLCPECDLQNSLAVLAKLLQVILPPDMIII